MSGNIDIKAAFKRGQVACRKTGTAHATGDGLRSMYADLVIDLHGGRRSAAWIYFRHLQRFGEDSAISEAGRELAKDRDKAYDVLLQLTS